MPPIGSVLFFYEKTDISLLRLGRRHELANRIKHELELRVVSHPNLKSQSVISSFPIRRQLIET
jgi:hypothetical protein